MSVSRILIILGFLLSGYAQSATYTLACKGGNLTSYHWVRSNVPWSKGMVKIVFFKTATGHNNRAVGANQCAWLDRKVRHNEPSYVCVKDVGVNSFSYERAGKHLATNYNTSSTKRGFLSGGFWTGRTFYIQVFNDNNGCLEFVRRGRS